MWDHKQALNTYDKALIIAEIRTRYTQLAKVALLISPSTDSIQQEDVNAWTMSNCINDDPAF